MNNEKNHRKEVAMEYKERKVSGGVFKITNKINEKYLILSDIDLKSYHNRFNFSVKTGSAVHPRLIDDWKKFKGENFQFEILEEIDLKEDQSISLFKESLKKLEEKWIERFDKEKSYLNKR
ncbi:GIY-YIG nuclease family protein [Asaccharospora irregularis]|uniref:GIY-YIG catalytic domain-containing protein n=1 Tax=Asaccharospora irregularis DSM 2635 TaxID=1121321 RepID=A0A1M5KPF6_9FIRM|nr:GIY-YIG nuclease family protein [Asaccharospora irregularis]SHG54732.1 hypothetical protein SAMN04488530_10365 [Asaccharospora irregularis DSM 2635]